MRKTPHLEHVGRAYSELSPLNPNTPPPNSASSTSTCGAAHRDAASGYGSLFPFGFFRHSFNKGGNSLQVLTTFT